MGKKSKIVFVGLSGGVDSSVAALRLIREGYTVVGVFIKVWHPDFLECNWEQERLDAMRIAAKLEIPFLTCDAEEAYEKSVAAYFIKEYTEGRTPNPDVMCNKHVKFGAFLKFALAHGADYIATGHYAQVVNNENSFSLFRGYDSTKDQSYFLWTLTQEQLARVLLPVGNSTKLQIRAEAKEADLLTAEKKDSQGICFLGHIDIPVFLSHYVDLISGDVIDENMNVIGIHEGALVYTIGQRHGFKINSKNELREAYYVVAKDIQKNIIVVSTKKPQLVAQEEMTLSETNYIAWKPKIDEQIEVQTRYRQNPSSCIITKISNSEIELTSLDTTEQVSVGQSCVLYKDNQCIGGGIISL